jgi:hypothetical protein
VLAKAIDEVAGTNLAAASTQTSLGGLAQVSGEDAFLDSQAQAQADQIAANNANIRATAVDLNNGTFLTCTGRIIDAEGNTVKDTGSSATASLTSQILSQNLTDKWQGEGFGTAQANAADMAGILASIGITDISQFGQITKEVPTYSYDDNGNAIETGTQTVQTFGNKVTGQEVPNTYSERQTGNAFGGTYAGSGNTAYRGPGVPVPRRRTFALAFLANASLGCRLRFAIHGCACRRGRLSGHGHPRPYLFWWWAGVLN